MISKLMIVSSLHVYELIFTTSSVSSFHKPKSTLETPVVILSSVTIQNLSGTIFK